MTNEQERCGCGSDAIIKIAETRWGYDPDAYVSVNKLMFYECNSCHKLY